MSTAPDLGEVTQRIRRLLPAGYRAVLFGSRATGRARLGSDWDIGLLGPRPLRGAVVERIREDLNELRTLHTFEVVDLARVPEDFRQAALDKAIELT